MDNIFVMGCSLGNFRGKGVWRMPMGGEFGPVPCGGKVSSSIWNPEVLGSELEWVVK